MVFPKLLTNPPAAAANPKSIPVVSQCVPKILCNGEKAFTAPPTAPAIPPMAAPIPT